MPIALVGNPEGSTTLTPASTLDFSSDGIRIQASVRLCIGELIHVQFDDDPMDLRQYTVVWTKPKNALRPGQAGLRSLKSRRKPLLGPKVMPSIEPGLNAA
jgi:hypothetical protein